MMFSSSTFNILEAIWIALAVFGAFYSIKLRRDAEADVLARALSGINSGKESLAKLLVITTSVLLYVFSAFLLAGLLAATIPSPATTSPQSYVIQFLLVSIEASLAWMAYYKQRVRHGVLVRDMSSETLRKAAATHIELEQMLTHTRSIKENTEELRLNTESRQHDATILAAATETLAAEHVENITALDNNTEATDRNTGVRDPETRTRAGDEV